MTINYQLRQFKQFVEESNDARETGESYSMVLPIRGRQSATLEIAVSPSDDHDPEPPSARRFQHSYSTSSYSQSAISAPQTQTAPISRTSNIDDGMGSEIANMFESNTWNISYLQSNRAAISTIVEYLARDVGKAIMEKASNHVWIFQSGHIYYSEKGVEVVPIVNNAGFDSLCGVIRFLVIKDNNNMDALDRLHECFQRAAVTVEELSIDYPDDSTACVAYLKKFNLNQKDKFGNLRLAEISNYGTNASSQLVLHFPNKGINLHFSKCVMEMIDSSVLVSEERVDGIKIDALEMYLNDAERVRKITELMKQFGSVKTQIWENLPSDINFEPEFVLLRDRTFIQVGDRYVHYITGSKTLATNDLALAKELVIKFSTQFDHLFIDGSCIENSRELLTELFDEILLNPVKCLQFITLDETFYQTLSKVVLAPASTFDQLEISLMSNVPSYTCTNSANPKGIYLKTDDIEVFSRETKLFCVVVTLKKGLSEYERKLFIEHLEHSHQKNPVWFLQLHTDDPNCIEMIREGIKTTVTHGMRMYYANIFELLSMEARQSVFKPIKPYTRRMEVIVKGDEMITELGHLPKDRESYRYDFQHVMTPEFWTQFAFHIELCENMRQIEFAGKFSSFFELLEKLGSNQNSAAASKKLDFIRIEIDSIEKCSGLRSLATFPAKFIVLVDTTRKTVTNEDVRGFLTTLSDFNKEPWKLCKLKSPVQGVHILAKSTENATPEFNFDDQGSMQYKCDRLMTTKKDTMQYFTR